MHSRFQGAQAVDVPSALAVNGISVPIPKCILSHDEPDDPVLVMLPVGRSFSYLYGFGTGEHEKLS